MTGDSMAYFSTYQQPKMMDDPNAEREAGAETIR